jgi:four helix bundle protein
VIAAIDVAYVTGNSRVRAEQVDHFASQVLGTSAAGSASDSEYQLLLARDLGYLKHDVHRQLDDQVNEVKRMLNSFMQKLI